MPHGNQPHNAPTAKLAGQDFKGNKRDNSGFKRRHTGLPKRSTWVIQAVQPPKYRPSKMSNTLATDEQACLQAAGLV
jgi:hypothetical protein